MSTKDRDMNDPENPGPGVPRKAMSRRAILKGSVVSMPAVLTLHSGAALARSSNLISGTRYGATDAKGRTLCLDLDSVYPASEGRDVYDLGDPPYARVSAINERDYRTRPRHHADRISEEEICERGGTYYSKHHYWGHWKETKVPRGMLVSATALTSFAHEIVITDL